MKSVVVFLCLLQLLAVSKGFNPLNEIEVLDDKQRNGKNASRHHSWPEEVVKFYGAWVNPCSLAPLKGTVTCDVSKRFEERAKDLIYTQIAGLNDSVARYAALSGNGAQAVPELNIPGYQWWSEALHGVANSPGVSYKGAINATTMFPQVITTAASFNADLFYQIGTAISTEGRAMFNEGQSGLTFWAPNINVFRDPRWGRGQETPGEDPFLNSVYAKNFVRGMQDGDDKYLKVSSCCKHYAAYSLENSDGFSRYTFDAEVSEYDEFDTYFPAFKSCVIQGDASSVMCSYNAVNGIPSCANKYILTELLREQWGFNGYITSDCGAVGDVINTHKYTKSATQTIQAVFGAGMDLDCGGYTPSNTVAAVKANSSILPLVQASMYRATLVQMRLGLFDDASSVPWSSLGPDDVLTPSNLALSLEAAHQGIVLLKNTNNVLPLQRVSITSLANIGPNANNQGVMEASYHGTPPFVLSVQQGLEKYVNNVIYELGVAMSSSDVSGIPAAVDAAKRASATILVFGLDQSQEREGHDRTILDLPGKQVQCISEVAAASKGPVILVILSGGSVDLAAFKLSSDIDAIVWAGYPGMYGGQAIADVLFGEVNPSARLTQTFYTGDYASQIAMDNMNMRSNGTSAAASPGRGYRYFTGQAVYPFGAGLSYTTFQCGSVQLSGQTVLVSVKNTGNVAGGVVVLVYFVPQKPGINGPFKRLVAFTRNDALKPGDTEEAQLDLYSEFLESSEFGSPGSYVASCPGEDSLDDDASKQLLR